MAITTPQSYYKVDSNSNDSIGGINGTDTGITYTTGKIGNAATNSTGQIALGTGNFGISTDMSISMWVYFNTTTAGIAIQKTNATAPSTDSWYIFPQPLSSIVQTFIGDGSSNVYANHTCSISTSTWTHLVFTYSGSSGNQKLYKDGTLISTIGGGPATINSAASNVILMNFATGTLPIDGKMDEIGIWNTEISASTVTELYNGGAGITYPFTSNSSGFFQLML